MKLSNVQARLKLAVAKLALSVFVLLTVSSITHADTSTKQGQAKECVILLHGLARTSASMTDLQGELMTAGFAVVKIDYPSRTRTVEELNGPALERGLKRCRDQAASVVHVVTHSMGGILFRQYVANNGAEQFARTVMLAPPNNGSEVVDALQDMPGFRWLNGPAGLQLGTGSNSLPLTLGPATNDVAVIAGTFSINLVLSTYLPDPDDGKVSVESTRLKGMCAHLQVDVSHPYIMQDEKVMSEVISYLQKGRFIDKNAEYPDCDYRTGE